VSYHANNDSKRTTRAFEVSLRKLARKHSIEVKMVPAAANEAAKVACDG
jgi:hypothetical protein